MDRGRRKLLKSAVCLPFALYLAACLEPIKKEEQECRIDTVSYTIYLYFVGIDGTEYTLLPYSVVYTGLNSVGEHRYTVDFLLTYHDSATQAIIKQEVQTDLGNPIYFTAPDGSRQSAGVVANIDHSGEYPLVNEFLENPLIDIKYCLDIADF